MPFAIVAATNEPRVHGDRDGRRCGRRFDRGVAKSLPGLERMAAQSLGALFSLDRQKVLQHASRYAIGHQGGRCARSWSNSGVDRQCDGQLMPAWVRPQPVQRNRGSCTVAPPNSVAIW